MTRKDCYVILGLCEGASLEDVKKAYRKRAFELHPDLNPSDQASKQFQALNEAYVLMLTWLEEDANFSSRTKASSTSSQAKQPNASGNASGNTFGNTSKAKPEPKTNKSASSAKAESKFDFAKFRQTFSSSSSNNDGTNANANANPGNGEAKAANASNRDRHISQQEVMDNVLRDPFARRAFEDIYSEIKRGGSSLNRHKNPQLGDALAFSTGKNVVNSVKSWFRKQIDDEQVVEVEATSLRPGVRIRLQIQQGISGKMQNIEVTLPMDYMPGRPLRLRGLGRKIGPWLGDLYLRIVPKPFKI